MKKSMMCSVCAFSDDTGKLLLRLTLAFAMIPHAMQKAFGVFGGSGLQSTWSYFTEVLGITPLFAGTAMTVEFFAPLLLILGIFTRVSAALLAVLMAVAMQYHLQYGFFLNWTGNALGEGVEFHLLYIGAAFSLMLCGGGRFSLLRFYGNTCDKPESSATQA